MNTLIINLKKDEKKYNILHKKCLENDINPIRIEAVYGKELSQEQLKQSTSDFSYNYSTPGQIGCWLSHVKCWNYIIDNNLDKALILEDDASFVSNYTDKIKNIEFPEKFDIVFLGNLINCSENNFSSKKLIIKIYKNLLNLPGSYKDISTTLYRPELVLGLHGYIITREGAIKCLNLLNKALGHLDHYLSKNFDKLDVYVSKSNLIIQDSETSDIASDFPNSGNSILNNVKIVDDMKLGWIFSQPVLSFHSYILCGWSIIFLLLGLLAYKYPVIIAVLMCILLVNERRINMQFIGSLILFLIGFLIPYSYYKLKY
jgi:glycosyl transferase family 25